MEPSKRFFTEWRAIKSFISATVVLCLGIVGFGAKSFGLKDVAFSPWILIALSALLYVWSCFLWAKSQEKSQPRKRPVEPEIARRNPAAKLPPRKDTI